LRAIKRLIIHHSASARTTTRDEIDAWHKARGWSGVGYHGVIEEGGIYVPGRPIWKAGAHCRGHNQDSIGICIVGNNISEDERWTKTQIEEAQRHIDFWKVVIPNLEVLGHRDLGQTQCPGIEIRAVFNL
jgi:N-acetyl-anhydromuramyl-L-alanine amidase AmpD